MEPSIDIPPSWSQPEFDRLQGTVLVLGAPDVGKSTFADYLFWRLAQRAGCVALVDGDPGQSRLGPPTTLTLTVRRHDASDGTSHVWRAFVGSVSPTGHMLPLLVGASTLVTKARQEDAQAIVYDTSGLIDPAQGGLALKLVKIKLLRPTTLFAIQRERELEALLLPLRRSRRASLVELPPAPTVRRRDATARQRHRARQFAAYFAQAGSLIVPWTRLAVLPAPHFSVHRLVALEDAQGFTLALGIVRDIDHSAGTITLKTPLASLDGIDGLTLGDVAVYPDTFEDSRPGYAG